jgi:hypothetical protein
MGGMIVILKIKDFYSPFPTKLLNKDFLSLALTNRRTGALK